jgi:hypothetical protein
VTVQYCTVQYVCVCAWSLLFFLFSSNLIKLIIEFGWPVHSFIMPRIVKVAATQFACSSDFAANVASAVTAVREAASQGANIILLQELFEGLYFCQVRCSTICQFIVK